MLAVETATRLSIWRVFCSGGSALFKNSQTQLEALQQKEATTTSAQDGTYDQLLKRIVTLEEFLRQHHLFVQKRSTDGEEAPALEWIRSHFPIDTGTFTTTMQETIDAAKLAIVIRVDDVEHEIRNVTSDIQQVNIQAAMAEIRALDHKMTTVQNDITTRLETIEQSIPEMMTVLKEIREKIDETKSSDLSSTTTDAFVTEEKPIPTPPRAPEDRHVPDESGKRHVPEAAGRPRGSPGQ